MGVDVSRGGRDESIIARLHGDWLDTLECIPGVEVPDGPTLGAHILRLRRDCAVVNVDAIGVGTSVVDFLHSNGVNHEPVTGSEKAQGQDASGHFTFKNRRAELWWKLREMLDPKNNPTIALPPDSQLRADLCAPRYTILEGNIIKVEPKPDIIKRIGRSPDRGDTVVYAFCDAELSSSLYDAAYGNTYNAVPKVKRSLG